MKISLLFFNLQSGHYLVGMAMFIVQKAIIPKVGKSELRFMLCTPSYGVLHLPEVSCEYHE